MNEFPVALPGAANDNTLMWAHPHDIEPAALLQNMVGRADLSNVVHRRGLAQHRGPCLVGTEGSGREAILRTIFGMLTPVKGKVVVIDFWTTFCNPCVGSLTHLNNLYAKNKDKGLVVIGISMDTSDTAGRMLEILSRSKNPSAELDAHVRRYAANRDILLDRLPELGITSFAPPDGAFYAFPDVSGTGFTARTLQDRWLEELGVATIAGTSFGARGEGHVRFSYASSLADIHEAMRRLGGWLHDHVA